MAKLTPKNTTEDATPTEDVARLTRQVRNGDADALTRLYESWFDTMYAWARNGTRRDEAFCLDVVQDAFVRTIRQLPVLESEAALGAWLRRVVLTCALDAMKKDRRRSARERRAAQPDSPTAPAASPVVEERLAWLRSELGTLSPEERGLIEARHRFGWTIAQAGRRFGLGPNAAGGRLARALGALSARAREVFDDE